ncbi:MAG: hypothetical protein ACPGQS_02925 [Bradymonadia bacterium]
MIHLSLVSSHQTHRAYGDIVLLCLCFMVSVLISCGQTEDKLSPPPFPFDADTMEREAIAPSGSLTELSAEDIETGMMELQTGLALPILFIGAVTTVIGELSEHNKKSASSEETITQRAVYAQTVESNVNGWVELEILCGDDPANHRPEDGKIDLVMLSNGDVSGEIIQPIGQAWGTARNCKLWGQAQPTEYDGDFALLLPTDARPITIYEMRGSQTTNTSMDFNYAGYLDGEENAWTETFGTESLVVGVAPGIYFIHDCSGRWICNSNENQCTYSGSIPGKIRTTCQAPTEQLISW